MPALKFGPLEAPPAPEIGVGPEALSVQAPEEVEPPLLLVTIFDSVRDGGMSLLVIVHEYDTPEFSVMLPFASQSPLNEAV